MPPKIFENLSFAISGKLLTTHDEIKTLITKHGGTISDKVTGNVSFLVTNADDVKAQSQKVTQAQEKGVPIIQDTFVSACHIAKKLLDDSKFALGKKRKAPKAPKAAPKPPAKRQRRKVAISKDVAVLAKCNVERVAGVMVDTLPSGDQLVWNAELVLNDPTKDKDKYFNLQLLAVQAGSEVWVAYHWGRTGMPGSATELGPFSNVLQARKAFRSKFRQKTGLKWGPKVREAAAVDGKYKLLAMDAAPDEKQGQWQYYLHNVVDGKKIAWYNYEEGAAKNMEKFWRQYNSNKGLEERFVQSDYFKYHVHFGEMTQLNTTSGTKRAIRRVPPGERPDPAPPAKIPEKEAPRAVAAAESDDEEDVGGGDDTPEGEDEEDAEAEEEPATEEAAEEDAPAAVGRAAPEEEPATEEADEEDAPAAVGRAAPDAAAEERADAKMGAGEEEEEEDAAPAGGRERAAPDAAVEEGADAKMGAGEEEEEEDAAPVGGREAPAGRGGA